MVVACVDHGEPATISPPPLGCEVEGDAAGSAGPVGFVGNGTPGSPRLGALEDTELIGAYAINGVLAREKVAPQVWVIGDSRCSHAVRILVDWRTLRQVRIPGRFTGRIEPGEPLVCRLVRDPAYGHAGEVDLAGFV